MALIKEHPYRRCKNEDKSYLHGQGRPTPAMACLYTDKNSSKVFCRLVNFNIENHYVWDFVILLDIKEQNCCLLDNLTS